MKHLFVVGGFTVRDRDPNAVLSLFEVFDPLVCEDYQHPLAVQLRNYRAMCCSCEEFKQDTEWCCRHLRFISRFDRYARRQAANRQGRQRVHVWGERSVPAQYRLVSGIPDISLSSRTSGRNMI